MRHFRRIAAAWLAVLMLCLCTAAQMLARAEAAGELTAWSDLDEISRHGNVYLVTDGRILLRDLEAAGIEPGDTVRVAFLDQSVDMPVGFNFSEAASGAMLLRIKEDGVELAINMDDFASTYLADKTANQDGSIEWRYKDGIEGPVAFHIELIRKGDAREEGDATRLTYTDARDDYPNLSDAAFANFRMVATAGMGAGALYRSSSPIDPKYGRNTYADKALKMAGVKTIMNLADSQVVAEGFEGYGDSCYATTDHIALGLDMSYDTDQFRKGLAEGLRFFASPEGPYAVHCLEGKDRTGVVAALLECFMGASLDEVRKDYMETFYNYYGVTPADPAYDGIAENNIAGALRKLFGVDDLDSADLSEAAEEYFRKTGLSDADIDALRVNLGKTYLDGKSKYANLENWAYYGVGEDRDADIFVIAPTVDKYDEYNMTLDDNNRFRLTRALNMQKGIYEDSLRMFAPYYAQMSFSAFSLAREASEPYQDIAYDDVSEAFAYYLEHENQGRPIVLFGYSQGGIYIYRLLKDYFGDEALYNRLIAAYAIGWGCTFEEAEAYPQIVPAAGENDTGCVISYDAEAPEVEDSFISPRDEQHFAINPLNWKTDATPADKSLNKGSVFVTNKLKTSELSQLCGAYLDTRRGVLKVTDVDPAEYSIRPDVLPEGSYHAYDLYFFWNNLRENIRVRVNAAATKRTAENAWPPVPVTVPGRPEAEDLSPLRAYSLNGSHAVDGRQGIAWEDGGYWVSGSTTLSRYDGEWNLVAAAADPFAGFADEVNHIGDIDVYNGEIYAGVEYFMDGEAGNIQIAVYDAERLDLTRTYAFEAESGQTEVSGIAVDPDSGSIWLCSWADGESGRYLYRYDLETGAYLGKHHLQPVPQWIQGIAYRDGWIYMTADDGTADLGEPDHVYRCRVDVSRTAWPVMTERTLDDVTLQGEVEGISFDRESESMLVSYNRGAQIVLGMPKGFYQGYDREIHEVFEYLPTEN